MLHWNYEHGSKQKMSNVHFSARSHIDILAQKLFQPQGLVFTHYSLQLLITHYNYSYYSQNSFVTDFLFFLFLSSAFNGIAFVNEKENHGNCLRQFNSWAIRYICLIKSKTYRELDGAELLAVDIPGQDIEKYLNARCEIIR